MKRIIGRSIIDDYDIYGAGYKVQPVNFDLIDNNAVHFRYRWTVDIIQNLRDASVITYNALDIGSHDGTLGAMIAKMVIDPGVPGSNSPHVDVVESYPNSVIACESLAKVVRERGFKMDVHNTTFEEFKPKVKYDIITAFEVLEHTKDPFFCIEKIYEMLEIGGRVLISVPEEHGFFGITDKNPFHLWTATAQSLLSTLFYDDRKWHVEQMFDQTGILHVCVKKLSYMG
jgi:hypothetical protein